MSKEVKNALAFSGAVVIMLLIAFCTVNDARAGGKHHNVYNIDNSVRYVINNKHEHIVNNYSGISDKDLATVAAMSGAVGMHHFSKSISTWQGSFAGSCFDSSADDCGVSFAVGKRSKSGDYLYSFSVTGASNERLYAGSIGWTW